jgi:uncharacterized protein involved in response to NO
MHLRPFASGFRPMFLASGVAAVVLIPIWTLEWGFGQSLQTAWPPTMWHAHEMLFGFVAAAIAGFLLTAVPSWTGQRGFAGTPLVVLSSLWLGARILIATSQHWPAVFVASVDVAFLVTVALLVAPPLLRSKNRNTPLLAVLALLVSCNAAFHWALAHSDSVMAYHCILLGIDIALLLVTVIGGRILPAFTANALRAAGIESSMRAWPGVSAAAIVLMAGIAVVDLFWLDSRAAGVLAGAAAVVQGIRMLQWRSMATLRQPIVWVLHLGYAWLPVGLALKCAALLSGVAFSAFWLHALTVGVLATMVLGVMTRAALGHTGRPLAVDPVVALGYLFLLAAGLIRVFGLAVLGLAYPLVIAFSAICWTAAFVIFLFVYAPILLSARADGKPG